MGYGREGSIYFNGKRREQHLVFSAVQFAEAGVVWNKLSEVNQFGNLIFYKDLIDALLGM